MIHTVDLIIIFLFLSGFAGFGLWQSRFNRTSEDYFLGQGRLPWIIALLSIVATETSVLTFISVPGLAYRGDWFFLQLALGYILGRILVSYLLLPQYFRFGVTSIYEVLGHRFGPNIQKTASGIFLITRVLADGVRFLATAVIVQAVTGWSLTSAVLVIGTVTLLYTLFGGIKTVVWVDSFQFLLYFFGVTFCIFYLFARLPAPPGQSIETLMDLNKVRIFHAGSNFLRDPWHAVPAVLGGLLLSFASHGADHMMVQRALVCRNLGAARKAMIGSGIFAFLQFALFLFAGSLLYLFFEGATLPKDREFATFIVNHLPVGARGLLLAGVLSAAMSTLSSSMNSLASSTIMDWLKGRSSLRLSQGICFFWAVVLIGMALIFDEGDTSIVELGLEIASFTYGGLLGLFLLSRSRRRFHSQSLIAGLASSLLTVLFLRHFGMAWTWFVGAGVAANLCFSALCERFIFRNR